MDDINFNKDLILMILLEKYCSTYIDNFDFSKFEKTLMDNKIINYNNIDSSYKQNYFKSFIKTIVNMNNKESINDKQLIVSNNNNIDFNNFKVIRTIGHGGFGKVYQCFNVIDNTNYAIKKIYNNFIDINTNNKILREVRILSKLDHPNIVRYYSSWIQFEKYNDENYDSHDYSYDDSYNDSNDKLIVNNEVSVLYIQMQLCNYTLKDYILNSVINIDEIKDIMKQICYGVKYLHDLNLIHRDLKPSNIFFDSNINVRIGDFGLVTINNFNNISDNSIISNNKHSNNIGTAIYASPEQYNSTIYDQSTDIYSLGIIFFELLYRFKTEMERHIIINKFKNNILPDDFIFTQYNDLLLSMISNDIYNRPNINQIIQLIS